MSSPSAHLRVSKIEPGQQRDDSPRSRPEQLSLLADSDEKALGIVAFLYESFGLLLREYGGVEALVSAMDREPSYVSKVREGVYRRDGRHVQLEWLGYLLADDKVRAAFVERVCEAFGFAPPLPGPRQVTEEQVNRAAREVMAETKDEEQRELLRKRIAKKLGVRIEDVRL